MGVLSAVINGGASSSVDLSTTVILAPISSSRNVIQATTTGVVPLAIKLATGSTSNLKDE